MNEDDLQAEVARLKAENERLEGGSQARVSLKVGAKGGVSLYGLGRFPVTLYKEQWVKLLDLADEIRAFLQGARRRAQSQETQGNLAEYRRPRRRPTVGGTRPCGRRFDAWL